jgi:hypothetical protein
MTTCLILFLLAAQDRRADEDELQPLRLSVLQERLPTGTLFYFRDPRQDPNGKLGDQPHPLRDIFRTLGRYEMRFSRKGYKEIDVTLQLTSRGASPALADIPLRFEPVKELSDSYKEAGEALATGNTNMARAALDRVRGLDESYLKTPEMALMLKELEDRIAAARESLRKGDLDGAARAPSLAGEIRVVQRAREGFAAAITRFDIPSAEEILTGLSETLTPGDPENRDRTQQIYDLKTLKGRLQAYEQICLDPQGIKERLADLWDQETNGHSLDLARSIELFCRHARYTQVRHEPFSFKVCGDEAQIQARLKVTYTVAAGESSLEETVWIRFKKRDGWRIAGYGRAE